MHPVTYVIDVEGTIVFHPYRTRFLRDAYLIFPRREMQELEDTLSERAGVAHSNHVVYAITSEAGHTVFIEVSDDTIKFGSGVVKGDSPRA